MKQFNLTMSELEVCKILDHVESMIDNGEGDERNFYVDFLTKIVDTLNEV